MKSFIATAFLAASVAAFTPPGAQTYGSLLLPDGSHPVTTGQTFTVTWQPNQPADGVTVSLVLCNGPSTNCVLQSTAIAEKIPAASGQYQWNVPCSLPAGTQSTASGYGMLIIVDGTGEFQYSTQFSVLTGSSCSSGSSTTTPASTSSATTSMMSSSSTSMMSSSSMMTTSSVSGMPTTSQGGNGGWYGWSSSVNSTSTVSMPTATSTITPTPISMTSTMSSSMMTSYYSMASSMSSPTTSATPKSFTGAAAIPTAFANAAGIVGAAVLGMMAL